MIDTTANLVISKSNEVFLKVKTDPHIEYELRDHFKFEVPNAKFMPQYRGRNWNGEIHLFDMRSKQIYVGLLDKICLLYTSPSPRDVEESRMPSSA